MLTWIPLYGRRGKHQARLLAVGAALAYDAAMMEFDFDTPIDRRGSDSAKWARYAGRDVIPMWVADMDFRSPPAVIDALRERADHGVFGYAAPPKALFQTIVERLARDYGWQIEPGWLVFISGVVSGLNVTCRAVGESGDEVITLASSDVMLE